MTGLADISTWIGFGGVVTLAAMFFRAGGLSEQLRAVAKELQEAKPKLDAFVVSAAVHEERLKRVADHDEALTDLEGRVRALEKYLSPARGTQRP